MRQWNRSRAGFVFVGIRACACVCAVILGAGPAAGSGTFHGHARLERIKDDPSKGFVELYEYKAFLSPLGFGTGFSYHIGDPGTAIHPGHGCITFRNVPAGTYTLMTSWGEIFPRGRILTGIVIRDGQTTEQDVLQPIDYSGYYTESQWDNVGANPVFQTFIATSTGINRVSFRKADANATGHVLFSIHRDNGGAVETWPQVGPTRSTQRGGGGDHWASWQGGEVPTTPGERYAVRLEATNAVNIQPYWCDDSFYPQGTGYRGSQAGPAHHDYYMAVFSDSTETLATILPRSGEIPLTDWWEKWAQSYTAQSTSFAGCTLMGSVGGSGGWDFPVKVSVHHGGPDGPQIGPTKTMPSGFRPFIGVLGASFAPGEIPTVVGQRYWIVYEHAQGTGFNACRMAEGDAYSGGTGYYTDLSGAWRTLPYDLLISVFEYAPSVVPTPTPGPGDGNRLLNPGFEESSGQAHPRWINEGGYWTNNNFPKPTAAREGAQWAGFSSGSGQTVQSGIYQQVEVEPGRRYRLSAWTHLGGAAGSATAGLYWADGDILRGAPARRIGEAQWTHPGSSVGWSQLAGDVQATQTTMTFLLRADIDGWGAGVNWDECFLGEADTETSYAGAWSSLFQFARDWQETEYAGPADWTGDGTVRVDDLLRLVDVWHETDYGQ